MADFSELPLSELLKPEGFDCPFCGRHHSTLLRHFDCGSGVVRTLPSVLAAFGFRFPFIVCDRNTYQAAAKNVETILAEAGIPYQTYIVPGEHIEPDEWSVGSIGMAFQPACDVLLAVGSGVLNDLCKILGHIAKIPSIVVGTAPSMDGYASNSSSMHVGGVKTTLYNAPPVAVLCDTDIMKNAPMRMLQAGLGDMLAKYVSLCEWRISNAVNGEYYCEGIARLVRRSVKKIVENAPGLPARDPDAIAAIAEGLTLSGVAMAFAECSRPASGIEHYFSHMWEMMGMERGEKADLHGIQVGVGTLLALKLYDWVRTLTPNRAKAEAVYAAFDPSAYEAMVNRIFGSIAPSIMEIEKKAGKNDPVKFHQRLDAICANWDQILAAIREELPPTQNVETLLRLCGAPITPADLGISEQDVQDAFTGSREIRDKYLSCSLLWDLGLTEEARARCHAQ